jgi:hypothetical protein
MKKIIAIITVTTFAIIAGCGSQKKVTYEFPETMKEPVLSEYVKLFDKGKILFDINCAKCHNAKVRKREIYPDFSSEELAGYDIRILNPMHEEKLTERNVTEEELAVIKTFLAYKKKNSRKDLARLPIKNKEH